MNEEKKKRGRPRKNEADKRKYRLSLAMTDAEAGFLRESAKKAGKCLTDFVLDCIKRFA